MISLKDEIKEILDRAKKLKYKCDCCEEITPGKYVMRNDKQTDNLIEAVYIIDKLLNYITNLQEENENLKKQLNCKEIYSNYMPKDTEFIIMSKTDYERQELDYKTRNEKAKELINAWLDGLNNDDIIILLNNLGNILNGEYEERI